MMGDVLLVIVKEAQNVKDIDALVDYLPVFPPTTILVLDYKYKKLDKRKSFAKQVDKMGVLFESKKLYDNKIPEWVMDYLKERKYSITPKACQMIVDFIGNDLHKIRNELEKLILALPKKKILMMLMLNIILAYLKISIFLNCKAPLARATLSKQYRLSIISVII